MSNREQGSVPRSAHLTGTHAIITGGGRGIGAAIADELARLGASVTLMGRSRDVLEAHASCVAERFGVRTRSVLCDVADEDSVSAAFAEARDGLGAPYVLVNNAGQAEGASVLDTSLEMWNRLLAVNLTGTFLCSRAVLPDMLEAATGRIINIASTAGLRGSSRITAYCASKHGVVGFTRALAAETAKRGITVNAVCPTYTDTDMSERAAENVSAGTGRSLEEARELLTRPIPIGRLVRPTEIASLVGWLCAPEAAAVTGTAIPVAGGEVM